MKTAVEWLIKELDSNVVEYYKEELEQAKAMEKEQIKDAWYNGKYNSYQGDTKEQYYNETYKTDKS